MYVGKIIKKGVFGGWGENSGDFLIIVKIHNSMFNYRYYENEEHGIGHGWEIEDFYQYFEDI